MRTYKLENSYYACGCGGTFYVDLSAQVYNISPAIYNYICDRCGKRKTMACEAEVRELAKVGEKL